MTSLVDRFVSEAGFEGNQPSADNIPKKLRDKINGEFIGDYLDLLGNSAPWQIVEHMREHVGSKGIVTGNTSDKPFFVSDEDVGINGATGEAYALVKPGKKDAPLRIIFAHTDIPCLKLNSQPIYLEPDAEKTYLCPHVYFSTTPYGGIRRTDWYGNEVDLIGKVSFGDREIDVNLQGRIKQMSVHSDMAEDDEIGDVKKFSALKVSTEFRTIDEVYNRLGIGDSMDFGRAEIYAYPVPQGGRNGRIVGNFLGATGHDDRVGVYTSTTAGLEAIKNETDNTLLIFGLNREEVGSTGNSGGYEGFFELVLRETLERTLGKRDFKDLHLPTALNTNLLGGYPAISADTDISMGDLEMRESEDTHDYRDGAKPAWGFFICTQDTEWNNRKTSRKHITNLMYLFDNNLPITRRRDRYQITGSCATLDSELGMGGTLADIFDKRFPTVDMGIPVIGLHNTHSEEINIYDAFWGKDGYRLYLEATE